MKIYYPINLSGNILFIDYEFYYISKKYNKKIEFFNCKHSINNYSIVTNIILINLL